jgi:hypothetical protein
MLKSLELLSLSIASALDEKTTSIQHGESATESSRACRTSRILRHPWSSARRSGPRHPRRPSAAPHVPIAASGSTREPGRPATALSAKRPTITVGALPACVTVRPRVPPATKSAAHRNPRRWAPQRGRRRSSGAVDRCAAHETVRPMWRDSRRPRFARIRTASVEQPSRSAACSGMSHGAAPLASGRIAASALTTRSLTSCSIAATTSGEHRAEVEPPAHARTPL